MTTTPDDTPTDITTRRDWAATRIRDAHRRNHGKPLPRYGSAAWHKLPPNDPRRWGAVIIAAECWAQDTEPAAIRQRVLDQLAQDTLLEATRAKATDDDLAQIIPLVQRAKAIDQARAQAQTDHPGTFPGYRTPDPQGGA